MNSFGNLAHMRFFRTSTAGVCFLLFSITTQAARIVHEPFDYPETTCIAGCNGGTGWRTPWCGTGNVESVAFMFSDAGYSRTNSLAGVSHGDASFAYRDIDASGLSETCESYDGVAEVVADISVLEDSARIVDTAVSSFGGLNI